MTVERHTVIGRSWDVDDLKLCGDYVLVKKHERERSLGGILLAGEGIRTEHAIGEVLAVGPGFTTSEDGRLIKPDVKVGDWVMAMDWMGEKVKTEKPMQSVDNYRIFREHAIWAKVKLGRCGELLEVDPYLDKILIRKPETNLKTKGGIHLAERNQSQGYSIAEVIKIGPGWKDFKTGYRYPTELKVGEWVCVQRFAGSIMPLDDQKEGEKQWLIEEGRHIPQNPYPNVLFVNPGGAVL